MFLIEGIYMFTIKKSIVLSILCLGLSLQNAKAESYWERAKNYVRSILRSGEKRSPQGDYVWEGYYEHQDRMRLDKKVSDLSSLEGRYAWSAIKKLSVAQVQELQKRSISDYTSRQNKLLDMYTKGIINENDFQRATHSLDQVYFKAKTNLDLRGYFAQKWENEYGFPEPKDPSNALEEEQLEQRKRAASEPKSLGKITPIHLRREQLRQGQSRTQYPRMNQYYQRAVLPKQQKWQATPVGERRYGKTLKPGSVYVDPY